MKPDTRTDMISPLEQEVEALRERVKALRAVLLAAPPRMAISDQRYWAWLMERDRVVGR